ASFLDVFNQLRNAPLLLLDDIGAQSDVGWVRDRLFQLINHRYAARLPTVFTASTAALERLAEERVLARLNDPGICVEVPITAPAYRVDMSARPSAYGQAHPQAPQRREPRQQPERRRYGGR